MTEEYFLNSRTADKWRRIGVKRRAGVCAALYSLYSEHSTAIGEFTDLKLLADWCGKTGLSIIQLLPVNDVGGDFAPYNSVSSFALDPMYLNINELIDADITDFRKELERLKKKYRPRFGRVNYKIKQAKITLLWSIYKVTKTHDLAAFTEFKSANAYWLNDYAMYKVISELQSGFGWQNWPEELREKVPSALEEIRVNNIEKLEFYCWMQWQLFSQMKSVKEYAAAKGIFILGDLPFLVSRESADVWAHKDYFILELASGAPPDMYFALGQKWGMPPYNWDKIASEGFLYLREKLVYAQNFYDMYRIDHFVGLFRVWVSPVDDNSFPGSYMPKEEYLWEHHGRRIIEEMVNSSTMLPCAEDLGTVPGCSFHVLNEFGIPGIDFQRYYKNNFQFRPPGDYRINSNAVLSTHDSSFWINWWQFEAGTIDEKLFELMCEKAGITGGHIRYSKQVLFDKKRSVAGRLYWNDSVNSPAELCRVLGKHPDELGSLVYSYMESYGEKQKFLNYLGYGGSIEEKGVQIVQKTIESAHNTASIFSIQLLQEYLSLNEELLGKISKPTCRINTPGSVSRNNWSQLAPISLEGLLDLPENEQIRVQLSDSARL